VIPILILCAAAAVGLRALWANKRGRSDPVSLVVDIIVAVGVLVLVIEGSIFFLDLSWWKELGQE